ncbi:TM2 domain-containing protein [Thermoanaerobacterium thermosaccharolyticum]|uniref:TM2 domain-containing protein n=1 Tax=Thermoanaerobacterium thermosaccharolyticum TaxID=1517 RepID=UPI002FD8C820
MDNFQLKNQLSEKQLAIFNQEYDKKKRSVALTWILWLFFGGLGIHRFYLGKTASAVILLILTLATAWFTFGIPTAIWLIVDAFLLPKMIGDKNREVEKEILNQIIGLSKSEAV